MMVYTFRENREGHLCISETVHINIELYELEYMDCYRSGEKVLYVTIRRPQPEDAIKIAFATPIEVRLDLRCRTPLIPISLTDHERPDAFAWVYCTIECHASFDQPFCNCSRISGHNRM